MTIFDYIEKTASASVQKLLLAAHCYLQETLPPFSTYGIKWKIPFYKVHRNICYLNRHPKYITLGFPQGYQLSPLPNILLGEDENLKRVRYLEIHSLRDLYCDLTYEVLQQAIILDELAGTNREGKSSVLTTRLVSKHKSGAMRNKHL
ncbi:MAG: hypothetical protein FD167_3052 [bacterium]|nr:MAG: hypothetical protein FD167_3052 [bacterium]